MLEVHRRSLEDLMLGRTSGSRVCERPCYKPLRVQKFAKLSALTYGTSGSAPPAASAFPRKRPGSVR